jgi:UDP-2,3-diacylglucosamine pyrophosphatase LpxH
MTTRPSQPVLRLRSVFISDVHLGFKGCRAEFLLDFLRRVECERIYLVGDIIDLWSLQRSFYWPQAHNDVIRTILGKAKHGTRVVYVPGNHDRPFRDHDGLVLGNVEIRLEAIHETADGRRFLVLHGDEFDSIVRASPLLESLGNRAYAAALRLNRYVNVLPQAQGQERGEIHRQLRARAGRRGAQPRSGRSHLRPHPSRRDLRHRRHPLLQ